MPEPAILAAVFFFFIFWSGLGTSIGYHRRLAHHAFHCPKFVEYFFVLGGIMGFQGSPIWWTTIHRSHHKYSDTPSDIHSPKHGFKFWDYSWFLKKGYDFSLMNPAVQCPDLCKDPVYRFLEQDGDWVRAQWLNFFGIAVCGRLLLVPFLGWGAFAVSLLAGFVFFQMPLIFNYVCHIPKLGYRTFAVEDNSVNVGWVALLWFGEGWHNNHHAFPSSASFGLKPHEFDLSWNVLRLMKTLKLAKNLNTVSASQMERFSARAASSEQEPGAKITDGQGLTLTLLPEQPSRLHEIASPAQLS